MSPPARGAWRAVLACGLVALVAGSGRTDDSGVIAGRVFDRDQGRPLPFAIVLVRSDPARWGTRVDAAGRFLLPGLPGGAWDLEAMAFGYLSVAGSVPVGAGETTEVTISLATRPESLSRAARLSGPAAPLLVAFPRSVGLSGQGLIASWHAGEFPRAVGFTDDGARLVLETRAGLTVFRIGDVRLDPEHFLRYPPPDSTDLDVGLGHQGLMRVRQGGDTLAVAVEEDPWLVRQPVHRLGGAAAAGLAWSFLSPDRTLVAARSPGSFRIGVWQLPEGKPVGSVRVSLLASCAGFVPAAGLLIVGGRGESHTVEVWDLLRRRLLAVIPNRVAKGSVRALAVDPRGTYVISGDDRHALSCWGLPDLRLRWRLAPAGCCAGDFLELSPDGSVLVTGSGSGLLFVEAATGAVLRELTTNHKRGILGAAFRPDGKTLATVGYDSRIALWDVKRILARGDGR